MRFPRFAPAIPLLLAAALLAQDLPPGMLLLSRVKRHVREELDRLPNVICQEIIERQHQPAGGRMRPLDTVQLEVLSDGHKETFASPGQSRFSDRKLADFVGSGMIGEGLFGMYLRDILVTGNVSNQYRGEEEIGGRRLARYDYRLPAMWSGQTIQIPEGSGTVGLRGSYWADPETYDVVRLVVNGDEFPPGLPVTELVVTIDYARTPLGDNLAVLLPSSADMRMAYSSGRASRNRIVFSQCRVFEARSTMSFEPPGTSERPVAYGTAAVDDTLRPLPPGLEIAVKLRTRISGDMAVGALIDGVVESTVTAEGVTIAAGSPVRGQIRRLERYTAPVPHFIVGIEFSEVESQGIRRRLAAEPTQIGPAFGVEPTLTYSPAPGSQETMHPPTLTGVAVFFVKGAALDLAPGLRTVWKMRPPAP